MQSNYSLLKLPTVLYCLPTRIIGSRIFSFKEVDSTNETAMTLAQEGAPEGTVIIADSQTKGRGRHGRKWFSPPKVGIYISIILRPKTLVENIRQITLLAAIAACEAINSHTGIKSGIKWPNDVIVNGRKLAGILVETQWKKEKVKHLVVGIGINVNHTLKMFPPKGVDAATSIAIQSKKEFSREELIKELLIKLEKWYIIYCNEGFDQLWKRLQKLVQCPGGWVEVVSLGQRFEGEVLGIDKNADLIIRTGEIIRRINQGRITINYTQQQHMDAIYSGWQ